MNHGGMKRASRDLAFLVDRAGRQRGRRIAHCEVAAYALAENSRYAPLKQELKLHASPMLS